MPKARLLSLLLVAVLAGCSQAAAPSGSAPSLSPSASVAPSVEPTPSPAESASPSSSAAASVALAMLPGEPDPRLTPGATNPAVTQETIGSTICVSGWTATVRPASSYTTGLKREQIAEYGYTDTSLADYEEDHLIPLELGGAPDDPANLWPEPYTVSLVDGTPVGARVKDQLENKLKALVCAGTVPLAEAQHEIATDWIRAWLATFAGVVESPASGSAMPTPPAPPSAPATAAAPPGVTVTIASVTSPVSPGGHATLIATTAAAAACSIVVRYKSGPSKAKGLAATTADASGGVSWTWTVGTSTTPGTWPITVTCSEGGTTATASTSFVVG